MIDISKLTDEDKGREVVYESPDGKREFGHISSWNGRFVFVKYGVNPQSQATPFEYLKFS
jgi:hypothetical protein